jgi:hypothetical protein
MTYPVQQLETNAPKCDSALSRTSYVVGPSRERRFDKECEDIRISRHIPAYSIYAVNVNFSEIQT